jgi:uncharacterized C2H2 Zn-finger protein
MGENQELKDGDSLPPCPKCGKIDKHNVSYHTHDLDHIFGFGEDDECEHPYLKHAEGDATIAFCPDCDLEFRCMCEECDTD